jgi:hypothetical protein
VFVALCQNASKDGIALRSAIFARSYVDVHEVPSWRITPRTSRSSTSLPTP